MGGNKKKLHKGVDKPAYLQFESAKVRLSFESSVLPLETILKSLSESCDLCTESLCSETGTLRSCFVRRSVPLSFQSYQRY